MLSARRAHFYVPFACCAIIMHVYICTTLKKIMKHQVLISLLAPAALLCACESVSFSSNIDPRNFANYYKPSMVQVVTYESLGTTPYRVIGEVKGMSLQERDVDLPANEADARTDLKKKAVDMGANALVIHKCITIKDSETVALSSVTCYGDALVIHEQ